MDAVSKADKAAEQFYRRTMKLKVPVKQLKYYVWELAAGTQLPFNFHISRDCHWTWELPQARAEGHHVLNSLFGEKNGSAYIEKLRELKFGGNPILELCYNCNVRGEVSHMERSCNVLKEKEKKISVGSYSIALH